MLAQDTDSRIVNIASVAGLLSHMPFQAPYGATKAAVVSLSESLRTELADAGANVGVTVVCPGRVATDVTRSDRSRPDGLEVRPPEARSYHEMISGMLSAEGGAMSIDDFGDLLLDAIRRGPLLGRDPLHGARGDHRRPPRRAGRRVPAVRLSASTSVLWATPRASTDQLRRSTSFVPGSLQPPPPS